MFCDTSSTHQKQKKGLQVFSNPCKPLIFLIGGGNQIRTGDGGFAGHGLYSLSNLNLYIFWPHALACWEF
jgi:hypothetical protein